MLGCATSYPRAWLPKKSAENATKKKYEERYILQKFQSFFIAFADWLIGWRSEEWTAAATVLLVIVTGLLAFVAYLQIKTARRQLRAYVFVHTAKIVVQDDEVTPPVAVVVIKNSGQTPACKLINVSGFASCPYPIQTMPNLMVSNAEFSAIWTRMDLGAGSTSASTVSISAEKTYATRAAKTEFVRLLSEGKLVAFVYGEVRYKDVFGRRQWTKYRLMTGGPFGFAEGQLVGCDEGNEAS